MQLSVQIRPWDTLACCWDVKQPTNKLQDVHYLTGPISNISSNNDRIEKRNWRFLQSPHCVMTCLQHVCCSGQGAIMCKSRATHWALVTCIRRSVSHSKCMWWLTGGCTVMKHGAVEEILQVLHWLGLMYTCLCWKVTWALLCDHRMEDLSCLRFAVGSLNASLSLCVC